MLGMRLAGVGVNPLHVGPTQGEAFSGMKPAKPEEQLA